MYAEQEDRYRPTGFMRNALVAQHVFQDFDDLALTIPLNDEYDWTELLGEQMGIRVDYRADLHSVLLFMLPEIQNSLFPWPPPQTQQDWVQLAEAATQGLTPLELYAALLAGPGRWLKGSVPAGTGESLPAKLRQLLVRSLASELAGVMTRWVEWNIRDLKARRDALIAQQQAEAAEALRATQAVDAVPVDKTGRRIPPPPQELLDRAKERGGYFQPPGRT